MIISGIHKNQHLCWMTLEGLEQVKIQIKNKKTQQCEYWLGAKNRPGVWVAPDLLHTHVTAPWRPWFDSWVGKTPWRRDRLPTPVFLGFSCGSTDKESAHSAGDLGSIPGLGRSPEEGKGYAPQYSGLENSMDCIVPGVAKSRTWLSDFHFHIFTFTPFPLPE